MKSNAHVAMYSQPMTGRHLELIQDSSFFSATKHTQSMLEVVLTLL